MEEDKPGNKGAGSGTSFEVLEKYREEHPFSSKDNSAETKEKERNPEIKLNELGLTDAEEELFRQYDPDLEYGVTFVVQEHICDVYNETANQGELLIVLGYIKRNLQYIVESRRLPIDPEDRLDEDSILTSILMPEKKYDRYEPLTIDGLGVDEYKNPEKLNDFFFDLAKNMNAKNTKALADKFSCINDGFTQIMAQFIPRIEKDIDKIVDENASILDSSDEEEMPWLTSKVVDIDSIWLDDDGDMGTKQDSEGDKEIKTNRISDEDVIEYLKFINSLPDIIELRNNGTRIASKLYELAREKKLTEFHADKDFMADFTKIMEHDKDKHIYYFHGTQCLEDAYSIVEQGLGVMRKNIASTAYPEFSMDDVILYARGFVGEIGRDAIVLIDVPIDENGKPKDIIEKMPPDYRTNFNSSGLQGGGEANYLIKPEHIVGFVDKLNKRIIFNDMYGGNGE